LIFLNAGLFEVT